MVPASTPPQTCADSTPRYTVAVRALCEFTARAGSLDLRFTPSPTAQEGMAGHGVVTARRPAGYRTEISLSGQFGTLVVRGRADGYDPARNLLEEIKTVRGEAVEVPENHRALHLAQARVYGWLLCQQLDLAELDIAVVYFDIVSQREQSRVERYDAAALRAFFEDQCRRFLQWAEREVAHRTARDGALAALTFPHAGFRTGQRELAETVYKANVAGRCLMAQAPTGIGKTIGTLFPALKAVPGQRIDKLFFLSARSTGRALALDAIAVLRRQTPAPPLRVLELIARDKACEHPDLACHGESCPLARGFYDRLAAARAAACELATLDRDSVRNVALAHGICPYYLGQELARWSDVVVADYNYYFDRSAMLYALTAANEWRVSVLVDEAHNLVERARGMYSAELDQDTFRGVRRHAPASLRTAMDRVHRQWNALAKAQSDDYCAYPTVPAAFVTALEQAGAALLDHLGEHPAEHDAALQRFYFDSLHFCRLAEQMTEHSLFDITRRAARGAARASTTVCVRNVVPAPFLRPRFAASHSTTLFSATLNPREYYTDMLGVPERTAWVEVASPFEADQLSVRIARHVSTRFAHRARSMPDIVALMGRQYEATPGNYLAFFSSHDYLQEAAALFVQRYPDIPCWTQVRAMSEAEQQQFLQAFQPGGRGIGFAVLGGSFAEGVDLPGDRLIGAFVATLGLPQFNAVNEQFRERMERLFRQGYEYTYLYPGLRKVVQAAGRVIRTRQDRGVVHLIDDRFARAEVRPLLPRWWQVQA
ncbi:ATP-dependent DNA helicase [Cupriavidus respiraculi]|uniref:3'-5' exonuclease DinG n=1 Tax=Cupriavidus respiraculi TaxID=195930 RepID=A0ABN7Y641_9BURK|nr:ATP-dependent DNA helicase [Cupriavidus respiraculi]CAG9168653.1 3'-5' exonuclease DinG [Cupriavidus respiraculi]